MIRRTAALLAALALSLGACGGEPGLTPAEQAVADAIAADFEVIPDTPFDDEAARCVAERMVGDFGVARLAAIGITPESAEIEGATALMTDAEMGTLADLLVDCVDFAEVFIEEMMGDGVSRASAECLTAAVAETEFFRDLLLAGVAVGFDQSRFDVAFEEVLFRHFGTFFEALGRCLSDEELARILGGDPAVPAPHPDARDTSVFELEAGDCFDDPVFAPQIDTVPVLPCAEPHDNEVYLVFDLPDGPYPGPDEVAETADERCLAEFETFVGVDYFASDLDFFTLTPTSASWDGGDRAVVCALYARDLSKLEGTMRNTAR